MRWSPEIAMFYARGDCALAPTEGSPRPREQAYKEERFDSNQPAPAGIVIVSGRASDRGRRRRTDIGLRPVQPAKTERAIVEGAVRSLLHIHRLIHPGHEI